MGPKPRFRKHQGQPDRGARLGDRLGELEQRQPVESADRLLDRAQLRSSSIRSSSSSSARSTAVQTDHIDWGFRSVHLYGIDYRYTTAGGWFSQQLLYHNNLYGYDPGRTVLRAVHPEGLRRDWSSESGAGSPARTSKPSTPRTTTWPPTRSCSPTTPTPRRASCSASRSTSNMVQGAIQSGTDMAPWYPGALPTGFFGWRWVSESNNDAFYTCLNNINNAKFRYFMADGHKAGHDNFNYIVTHLGAPVQPEDPSRRPKPITCGSSTRWWAERQSRSAESLRRRRRLGKFLPGNSPAYGVLNYTMFQLSKRDYFTVRNEWWRDQRGERSGFATNYSSHTIGISHQFNDHLMIPPPSRLRRPPALCATTQLVLPDMQRSRFWSMRSTRSIGARHRCW